MSLSTSSTAVLSSSPTSSLSTASSPSSLIQVITITVVALTTIFTPPPSCTETRLTQLSSPGYQIWLNEPNPVPKSKFGDCYPSQFIQGYTSIVNASSSIAPMFSPLVCPSAWSTAKEWENGYIACCASGFLFHPPDTTVDTNRPGYGGTCYSNFEEGQTVDVTVYDSESVTATAAWVASTNTDQAYAHPIDGFKLDDASSSASLSGGAIAGIVIGAVAALSGAVFIFCLYWRRRRAAATRSHDPNAAGSTGGTSAYGGPTALGDLNSVPHGELPGGGPEKHGVTATNTLPSGQGFGSPRYELGSPPIGELDGGWPGNELRG